jgi:transposase
MNAEDKSFPQHVRSAQERNNVAETTYQIPEFQARVVLAACQGESTMAELVKKFDVHANHVTDWKKQPPDGASDGLGRLPRRADHGRACEEV